VRVLAAAFCLLIATACDEKSSVAPTVPLNERFTLAPGQRVQVESAAFQVEFLGVSADSRCPADVVCIWAGDAVVQVRVSDASQEEYELHTGDATRTAAVHGQARIELVELQPYPFSSRAIAPADYRATLTVTRR
jgi:hypothetical protein